MPLYKSITVDEDTHVLIWKIEESFEQLSKGISLTKHCQQRVDGMKSDIHRRGFMSIRQLLAIVGYSDNDLYYNDFGKPYLVDGKQISITHSFEFSAIIISNKIIGIDIEKQREKINKISHKFVTSEANYIIEEMNTRMLTVIWGSKESLYKLYATPGLSFAQHITIHPFELSIPFATGTIAHKDTISHFMISFLEFEGFTCTYAMPMQNLD